MKKYVFCCAKSLVKAKRRIAGMEVKYKLYEHKCPCGVHYAIEIIDRGGRGCRSFGKDKVAAFEIYKRIVECSVTSCTFDDIADDFAAERNLIG